MHGQTDDRLTAQYRDGFVGRTSTINYRNKRIDHIFTAGETIHSAASFDLSCGVGAPSPYAWNCDNLAHPDAYSDHRIVWAFRIAGPATEQYAGWSVASGGVDPDKGPAFLIGAVNGKTPSWEPPTSSVPTAPNRPPSCRSWYLLRPELVLSRVRRLRSSAGLCTSCAHLCRLFSNE